MTRNDEIRVRRRDGGVPWWAWVVALVLLALLAWWLLTMNQDNGGAPTSPTTSPSPSLEIPSGTPAETTSPGASGSPAAT